MLFRSRLAPRSERRALHGSRPTGVLGQQCGGFMRASERTGEHSINVGKPAGEPLRRLAKTLAAFGGQWSQSIIGPAQLIALEGDGVTDQDQLNAHFLRPRIRA